MTLAAVMFFTTLWLLLRTLPLGQVAPAVKALPVAEDDPSWKFRNPDIDQWVSQIKNERDALAVREQQLKEWESRLVAESREIASVTQAVSRTQLEFDKRVLLFTEQQKDNAKKQLKVIADMTPDGAVAMLNEMPDDEVARLLYTLKPDISGAILDAMSKVGGPSAKRAAALTERIKDILQIPTNNPPTNVSP
jgi:flagellar motility protein MotE (MotC chaperone)